MNQPSEERIRKQDRCKVNMNNRTTSYKPPRNRVAITSEGNPYKANTPKHFAWELCAHVIRQAQRAIAGLRSCAGIPTTGPSAAFMQGTIIHYKKMIACAKLIQAQIGYRTEFDPSKSLHNGYLPEKDD